MIASYATLRKIFSINAGEMMPSVLFVNPLRPGKLSAYKEG